MANVCFVFLIYQGFGHLLSIYELGSMVVQRILPRRPRKYTGRKENRYKRALLPFISKASKYLFGTMDEEEGDELL
jgi:hypothetical protein